LDSSELERAILVYLGADPNGAVQPIGKDERVRAQYGPRADLILHQVRKTLGVLDEYERDWSVDTLQTAAGKVEQSLAQRLPHLSSAVHKAMANYWSYGWR
jgi:hypothetical protein